MKFLYWTLSLWKVLSILWSFTIWKALLSIILIWSFTIELLIYTKIATSTSPSWFVLTSLACFVASGAFIIKTFVLSLFASVVEFSVNQRFCVMTLGRLLLTRVHKWRHKYWWWRPDCCDSSGPWYLNWLMFYSDSYNGRVWTEWH